uniref:Cell division protein n=1 Tax=Sarcinofilum mucosum TaxID=141643 RepID=A0A1W6EG77_SARMC|nr:cell division protein [Sarcinofilum mucosum]ARK14387.1 cell division protein [Sarcinofilum mucosum]
MINFKNNIKKSNNISENLFLTNLSLAGRPIARVNQKKSRSLTSLLCRQTYHDSKKSYPLHLSSSLPTLLTSNFYQAFNVNISQNLNSCGRLKTLKKIQPCAGSDKSKNVPGPRTKYVESTLSDKVRFDLRKSLELLNYQKTNRSIKKSVQTVYYLLIAYKKTLRVKLNYYFNNSTNLQFFLALSPFLIYFIQMSVDKYELQYQQNTFLQKSLPGLKKPIQNMTWETFAYTKYSNKLDSNLITQINSVDNGFFISLNPGWQFKQKQLLAATFESSLNSTKKWSFLPSRYFYQLLSETQKRQFNQNALEHINQKSTKSSRQIEVNSRWQIFFNELDDIPTKLNSVFQTETNPFKSSNQPTGPLFRQLPLLSNSEPGSDKVHSLNLQCSSANQQVDSLQTVSDKGSKNKKIVSDNDFKKQFTLLTSNYQEFAQTKQELISNQTSESQRKPNLYFQPQPPYTDQGRSKDTDQCRRLLDFQQIHFTPVNLAFTEIKKDLLFGYKKTTTPCLDSANEIKKRSSIGVVSQSSLSDSSSKPAFSQALVNKNSRYQISEKNDYLNFQSDLSQKSRSTLEELQVSSNLPSRFIGDSLKSKLRLGDQTWIRLLTETWLSPLQTLVNHQSESSKKISFQRTFHYNVDSGFSKIGNLIKINVLERKTKNFNEKQKQVFNFNNAPSVEVGPLSKVWPTLIRQDLRSPIPAWVRELKTQTFSGPSLNDSQKTAEILPPSFLQFNQPPFFIKSEFPPLLKEALMKNPESLLELFQKPSVPSLGAPYELRRSYSLPFFNRKLWGSYKGPADTKDSPTDPANVCLLDTSALKTPKGTTYGGPHTMTGRPIQEYDLRTTSAKGQSLFIQRKLSGYLYPDSLRETILMNNGHNFIETNPQIRKTNSLLESYNQKFSAIISQRGRNKDANLQTSGPRTMTGGPIRESFVAAAKGDRAKTNKEPGFLLQVYQPLTPTLMALRGEKNVISNTVPQISNILTTSSLQKNNDFLTRIEPDQSFSTKKDYFFGIPIESPIYGLTGKDYKEKYETRKRDIPKDRLVHPYTDFFNFLTRSNSKLLKAPLFGEDEPGFGFSNSNEFSKKALLTEMTKAATFSNVVSDKPFLQSNRENGLSELFQSNRFEKPAVLRRTSYSKTLPEKPRFSAMDPVIGGVLDTSALKTPKGTTYGPERSQSFHGLSFFKKQSQPVVKQKTEKVFGALDAIPVPYKTQLHYTKARVFSNTVNSLEKSLKRSSFSTNLYEPISFKTWAILSQFGFVFIVSKLSEILQKEYNEEVLYYIAEFYAFLNDYDKNSLQIFSQGENIRVIKKINKKFSDLVGGRFLLTEFGEAILLLRNSRKRFSKMKISKPQFLFLAPTLNVEGRAEKPNLKLENFIPKGILLVGPPGTGKTLLVQAFAGEAAVPVIVESGKMLTTNMETNGAERLKDLFKAAREMSPCILFLDEVDTLGQKREKVLSATMVGETQNLIPNPLNGIYSQNGVKDFLREGFNLSVSDPFNLSWDVLNPVVRLAGPQTSKSSNTPSQPQNDLKIQITNQKMLTGEKQNQDLHLLTQLLYELDGLNKREDIIVIGATNRPATLDSALTRPGRFGKIIYLDLPGKQKRFELLKFYSQSRNNKSKDYDYEPERFLVSPSEVTARAAGTKDSRMGPPVTVGGPFFDAKEVSRRHSMAEGSIRDTSALIPSKKSYGAQSFWLAPEAFEKDVFSGGNDPSKTQTKPKKVFATPGRVLTTLKQKENSPPLKVTGDLQSTIHSKLSIIDYHLGLKSLTKNKFKLSNISNLYLKKRPKSLGVDANIDWNYFANQTVGLSSAHLSAAMNRSALKAMWIYFATLENEKSMAKFFSSTLALTTQNVSQNTKSKILRNDSNHPIQNSLKTNDPLKTNSSKELFKPYQELSSEMVSQLMRKNPPVLLSKELKLRLIFQSELGNTEILNQFFLIDPFGAEEFGQLAGPRPQRGLSDKVPDPAEVSRISCVAPGLQKRPGQSFSLEPIQTLPFKASQKKQRPLSLRSQSKQRTKESFHTFETIEYGIQTVSTMNTSLQIRTLKGKQVNKKIVGLLPLTDFLDNQTKNTILPESNQLRGPYDFFEAKEVSPTDAASVRLRESFVPATKGPHTVTDDLRPIQESDLRTTYGQEALSPKNGLKRNRFYKKHRLYLRTLAGLDFENQVNSNSLTGLQSHAIYIERSKLKILNKYVNRILQNRSFGWLILSNSTCLIKNPFFSFSIQKQKTKKLNGIYYHLLSLNNLDFRVAKETPPLTFLKWQNFNFKQQNLLFGDSLFINRSAYYLSGKSLINFSNQNQLFGQKDQPISLWSFTGSSREKTRHPKFSFQNGFITKIHFENFLLSLIAGKAAEKLMLTNSLQKQESNIGLDELKELRGLVRYLLEDYVKSSPKQLTRKQINVNLVENSHQILHEEELLFLKELATGFENQNCIEALSIPRSSSLKSSDQFASVNQPWWQLKSLNLVASSNLKYGQWYRLFVSEEQQTFRNIEWVAPDTYFHNQVNNAHLASNFNGESKTRLTNTFINKKLGHIYSERSKLNWNQLQLLESESMASHLMLLSFNKVFILLENNREFLDLVSYSLICYENLRQFEILDFYQRFFKKNK